MQLRGWQPHLACTHSCNNLLLRSILECQLPHRLAVPGCADLPRGSLTAWTESQVPRAAQRQLPWDSPISHGSCSLQCLQPAAARGREQKVKSLFSRSSANRVLKSSFYLFVILHRRRWLANMFLSARFYFFISVALCIVHLPSNSRL